MMVHHYFEIPWNAKENEVDLYYNLSILVSEKSKLQKKVCIQYDSISTKLHGCKYMCTFLKHTQELQGLLLQSGNGEKADFLCTPYLL